MTAGELRIGLYPGTFDPVTLGHMDVVRRSLRLVDRLVVGVAINAEKNPLFSLDERVQILEAECAQVPGGRERISVRPCETLLMRFAEEVGAGVIIRGLRAVSDFEYEFQMVGMNRALNDRIELAFLMADPQHQAIASRLVKEIARLGGDTSKFVSPLVRAKLEEKIAAEN